MTPAPISPLRCQCLSYRFDVTADDPWQRQALFGAFAPFQCAEGSSHDAPQTSYRIADRGPSGSDDRYSVVIDGAHVRWSDEPTLVLDWLLWHVHVQASTREREHVVIHAGSVAAPNGGGVLLPAPSGSGKSTTTLALLKAGFGYLSDEFAVLDPQTGLVHPYARPLGLKPGTRALFPELDDQALLRPATDGETAHIPASAVGHHVPILPIRPRWIVLLRHVPGAGTRLEPLSTARTVLGLAKNTVALQHQPAAALGAFAGMMASATGWELTVDRIEDGVAKIRELTSR